MGRRFFAGLFCFFMVFALCSCSFTEGKTKKVRDIEYTVVKENEIPDLLRDKIEEQKEETIKLTYLEDEYLYIVKGYGKQDSGGYSISVKDLYLTENAVYFSTDLHGPKKGEIVTESPSYPYIVIKVEKIDEPVVFE